MRSGRSSVAHVLTTAVVVALALVGATAAGASKNKGPSAVSIATAAMQKAAAPVPWKNPGPRINAKKARGKTVAYVPVNSTIPFTTGLYAGFSAAMRAAGVHSAFFDTNGTPADWSKAVYEAVSQKVKVIVLQGEDPGLIAPAITAANKAHIPVIESFVHNLGSPISPGTATEVTYSISTIGKLVADYEIALSKASVHTVDIQNDSPVSALQEAAIRSEFGRLCPATCKVEETQVVPTPDWATKIPGMTQSLLLAHPDLNFMNPLTDGEVIYVAPGLKAAGKVGTIKLASFNATPGVMSYMTESDHILGADIGTPLDWTGFILADQTLRLLVGAKPLRPTAEPVPLRLFTPSNFTAKVQAEPQTAWYGKTNYRKLYFKLWGLK